MTARTKRIVRSVVYGTLTQGILLCGVYLVVPNELTFYLMLWNVGLATMLAGPMPRVGTLGGHGIYEPTAVHAAWGIAGLALGVAVYSALIYRGLTALETWVAKRADHAVS